MDTEEMDLYNHVRLKSKAWGILDMAVRRAQQLSIPGKGMSTSRRDVVGQKNLLRRYQGS